MSLVDHSPLVIDDVRVRVLEAPLAQPVRMSFSSLDARRSCLVEIRSGDLVGIGESWANYPTWAWEERVATLKSGIRPLLLGRDAHDIERLHLDLIGALLPIGRQSGAPGPVWQAISGVDLALWDLFAKARGVSVASLLSDNVRQAVPVYASGIGPDSVHELVEYALAEGFRAVKVKIGFGREEDEAVLRAVREVAGDSIAIFADANQSWDLGTAVEMCGVLADFGVGWCEEPLADDRFEDLVQLSSKSTVPLATGENLYGLAQFSAYYESGAISRIQPDVAKSGGLTVALKVATAAAARGVLTCPHCYTGVVSLVASAHLAASCPSVEWVEFDVRENPLRSGLTVEPLTLRDGMLMISHDSGFGLELDQDKVSYYEIGIARERFLT